MTRGQHCWTLESRTKALPARLQCPLHGLSGIVLQSQWNQSSVWTLAIFREFSIKRNFLRASGRASLDEMHFLWEQVGTSFSMEHKIVTGVKVIWRMPEFYCSVYWLWAVSGKKTFYLGIYQQTDFLLWVGSLQTCLLLRFWCKVYALKALFTLLRLSCHSVRFSAAVSDFGLPTIDLCDKFICEDGDRVRHMKDAFWLAVGYARPNQL